MIRILSLFASLRFVPHIFVYYHSRIRHTVLDYERDMWLSRNRFQKKGIRGFLFLLNMFPEYRSLFYHRTGAHYLSLFARGQNNLYFHTPSSQIGKGLVIWHGYSCVVNAQSIGEPFRRVLLCDPQFLSPRLQPATNRSIIQRHVITLKHPSKDNLFI